VAKYGRDGTPVIEPHWLEVDLQRPCHVTKIVIDWESAYSNDWVVQVLAHGLVWFCVM